jgi:hypothetical protein
MVNASSATEHGVRIRYLGLAAILGAVLSLGLIRTVHAQDHWHGEINRFHEHDYERWRGGHWFHGVHGGRRGWYWVVGGVWYYYPAPVYPYPDPYQPPVVVVPPPANPAAPAYWYYCGNPAGYYPYVAQCRMAWQRVIPQTPVPAPPAPPPPG